MSELNKPTTSHRMARISDLIREEVAKFLISGVRARGLGFVTVTHAVVTRDLGIARIYYTAFGSKEQQEKSHYALVESIPRMRNHLARTVRLRHMPRIEIYPDDKLDTINKVTGLLDAIAVPPVVENH